MSKKIIKNVTEGVVDISDMGISLQPDEEFDFTFVPQQNLLISNDLIAKISSNEIKLIQDSLSDPITFYSSSEAIRLMYSINQSLPRSGDGIKIAVHSSAKPMRTSTPFPYNTHWTGAGDDVENHIIGGGTRASVQNEVDVPVKSVDIEFDPIFGDLFIYEGYISYKDAGFGDAVSVSFLAKPSSLQTSVNLDLELDGDKVKYSPLGPSTGTHGFASIPVIVPNYHKQGHWDLDGEDLSPNFTQKGLYDIYTVEKEVDRFINMMPLCGTCNGFTFLEASDYTFIPPGYFMRITCYNNSNTAWTYCSFIECYRERSVDSDF